MLKNAGNVFTWRGKKKQANTLGQNCCCLRSFVCSSTSQLAWEGHDLKPAEVSKKTPIDLSGLSFILRAQEDASCGLETAGGPCACGEWAASGP